jgi:CRISPR-associated protein (TIGR03984 family)
MNRRELKKCSSSVRQVEIKELNTVAHLTQWLTTQAKSFGCTTLLAHAEDGVIWGRFDKNENEVELRSSYEAELAAQTKEPYSAALHPDTLWQARLFGADAEVLLWREQGVPNAAWQSRVIEDKAGEDTLFDRYFDEPQLLLGYESTPLGETGFTRMREGSAELVHVLPMDVNDVDRQHRVKLVVRHYLSKNEPLAWVAATRLVKLISNGGEKNG